MATGTAIIALAGTDAVRAGRAPTGAEATLRPPEIDPALAPPTRTAATDTADDVGSPTAAPSPAVTRPNDPTLSDPDDRRDPRMTPIPRRGPGTFDPVTPSPRRAGDGAAATTTNYTIEIERNLPFDPDRTADRIARTLDDPRGWTTVLAEDFDHVAPSSAPDLRILVATPGTTDRLCAPLQTLGRVSCRNGELVVLNAVRWGRGIPDYRGRLTDYRRYVVNHEVGHAVGQEHASCTGPGQPAPVMQQQTYGLNGCARNPWPTVG